MCSGVEHHGVYPVVCLCTNEIFHPSRDRCARVDTQTNMHTHTHTDIHTHACTHKHATIYRTMLIYFWQMLKLLNVIFS